MAPDRFSAAAAEFLGISVTILRRQARDGVIPAPVIKDLLGNAKRKARTLPPQRKGWP